MDAKSTIEIPKALAERLKKRSAEAGFDSVNSYAEFVLGQILDSVQSGSKKASSDEAEEELVKKRLRSLGYD